MIDTGGRLQDAALNTGQLQLNQENIRRNLREQNRINIENNMRQARQEYLERKRLEAEQKRKRNMQLGAVAASALIGGVGGLVAAPAAAASGMMVAPFGASLTPAYGSAFLQGALTGTSGGIGGLFGS